MRNPACYCKPGFVFDCQGKCVSSTQYCKTCNSSNEYYTDCAPNPEPSCKNSSAEATSTIPKCTCKTGFVRDYTGNCILYKNCPSKNCLINLSLIL